MKNFFSIIVFLVLGQSFLFAQAGKNCEQALVVFPSLNCENTDGQVYFGKMSGLSADFASYFDMSGKTALIDPACSEDDERKQSVVWIKVRATSDNFTINNGSAYIGSGAAAANTKDYVVFAGSCSNMMQIACHTLRANTSALVEGLEPGQDYYIMASPAVTQTKADAISLCVTSSIAYVPAGDLCSEAVALEINNPRTFNNAGASADGPVTNTSVENNTWYKWKTPEEWVPGKSAYLRIYDPVCNSIEGLQVYLWNSSNPCADNNSRPAMVSKTPETDNEYYYQWTPRAGLSYYISVDGYAGTACQFKIEIGARNELPVNLITLDAQSNGSSVELSWITAEESNNSSFTIEKSNDAERYIPLMKIPGAGKSTTERSYQSRDEYPFPGINYYRLKQTDSEGNYTYTKTVAVNVKGDGNLFHASIEPGDDKIDLAFFSTEAETGLLRMYDHAGKQMYNMSLQLFPGRNNYKIHSLLFPEGAYTIKLETATARHSENILLEDE
ncbi:MAG TPA: hypothetical protein PKM97_08835 [Bacteroidia bacterium]|nr:hypothetical protein [Bacteroidia bacterium]